MNDVDLALNQISNIRAQLAATTRFLGLSPEFNLLLGGLAILIAIVQVVHAPGVPNVHYIAVWSAYLLASCGMAAVDAVLRARREHGRMANAVLAALMQKVFPFVVTLFALTWVLCRFSVESLWLLPGLWQMLLGLMGFAALSSLPRALGWIAAWFILCGIVVLGVAALDQSLSPWMMGLPFGIGLFGVGLILARTKGDAGAWK